MHVCIYVCMYVCIMYPCNRAGVVPMNMLPPYQAFKFPFFGVPHGERKSQTCPSTTTSLFCALAAFAEHLLRGLYVFDR